MRQNLTILRALSWLLSQDQHLIDDPTVSLDATKSATPRRRRESELLCGLCRNLDGYWTCGRLFMSVFRNTWGSVGGKNVFFKANIFKICVGIIVKLYSSKCIYHDGVGESSERTDKTKNNWSWQCFRVQWNVRQINHLQVGLQLLVQHLSLCSGAGQAIK